MADSRSRDDCWNHCPFVNSACHITPAEQPAAAPAPGKTSTDVGLFHPVAGKNREERIAILVLAGRRQLAHPFTRGGSGESVVAKPVVKVMDHLALVEGQHS